MARLSNAGASRNSSTALAPVPEGRASTATSQHMAPMPAATASGCHVDGYDLESDHAGGRFGRLRRCDTNDPVIRMQSDQINEQ